ncbi:uncharacterized protein [Apostichopus japonicus]|uniref:uncharacterized protein n=1 Tax=Stichopus japonicus TaxID=307972 RepID=UPI003AB79B96
MTICLQGTLVFARHSDKDEFEAKLKRCRDNYEDTAEIFKCPSYVAGQRTTPECGVTKQTIEGHVTSFSRGCHYLRRCAPLRNCYDRQQNHTGVCQFCCNKPLCNQGTLFKFSWDFLLLCMVFRYYIIT